MNLKNILNNFPKRDSIIVLKIFRQNSEYRCCVYNVHGKLMQMYIN